MVNLDQAGNAPEKQKAQSVINELGKIYLGAVDEDEREWFALKQNLNLLDIKQCNEELVKIKSIFDGPVNLSSESNDLTRVAEIREILEARLASLENEAPAKKNIKKFDRRLLVIPFAIAAIATASIPSLTKDRTAVNNPTITKIELAQTLDELNLASPEIKSITATTSDERTTLVNMKADVEGGGIKTTRDEKAKFFDEKINALETITFKTEPPKNDNFIWEKIKQLVAKKHSLNPADIEIYRIDYNTILIYTLRKQNYKTQDVQGG